MYLHKLKLGGFFFPSASKGTGRPVGESMTVSYFQDLDWDMDWDSMGCWLLYCWVAWERS